MTRPLLALLCLAAIAVAPAPSTEFDASVEKIRGVLLRTSEARGAAHLERDALCIHHLPRLAAPDG